MSGRLAPQRSRPDKEDLSTPIKKLGSMLARHTGEEESSTTQKLFQRLSISLMRGNAALFNNRSPPDQVQLGDELTW